MKNNTPEGFVYLIGMMGTKFIKIGYSAQPNQRLKELQTACPFSLKLIGFCPGSKKHERGLHHQLRDYRRNGEWFEFDSTEAMRMIELACLGRTRIRGLRVKPKMNADYYDKNYLKKLRR